MTSENITVHEKKRTNYKRLLEKDANASSAKINCGTETSANTFERLAEQLTPIIPPKPRIADDLSPEDLDKIAGGNGDGNASIDHH